MENEAKSPYNRFSEDQIRNYISSWHSSGKSKKNFAEENGLKYYTFVSWFERYKTKPVKPAFTEVKLPTEKKVFAEVKTGSTTIRFFQAFPLEYFQLLIK